MTLVLSPGTLVEHKEWGRGKVLEVHSTLAVVYFPTLAASAGGPRRKMALVGDYLSLAEVHSDPVLDSIRVGPPAKARPTRRSSRPAKATALPLEHALARFRADYPGLFQDPKLIREEIGYKRDAHAAYLSAFGNGGGKEFLRKGDLDVVAGHLDGLFHATNIPSRFEIMAAHDGFKNRAAAGGVLGAVLAFVESPETETFEALLQAIRSLPQPAKGSRVLTWPNVTILPFLADPGRFMVLKPGISQQMAQRMGFDLLYSPTPTWHCYQALLEMSALLLDRLKELGASDYIDVQSFMWVTRGID